MEPLWDQLEQQYDSGMPLIFVESVETSRVLSGITDRARRRRIPVAMWSPGPGQVRGYGDFQDTHLWEALVRPMAPTAQLLSSGDGHPAGYLRKWAEIRWPQQQPVWLVLIGLERYWHQPGVVYGLVTLYSTLIQQAAPVTTIVVVTSAGEIPKELAHTAPILQLPLPTREEAAGIMQRIVRLNEQQLPHRYSEQDLRALAETVSGLTAVQIQHAAALSLQVHGILDPAYLTAQKAAFIARSGVLEVVAPAASLESIGGLEALKRWALVRRRAFDPEAQAWGLPAPKGVLVLGPPGTGKSLFGKALAAAWHFPLVRLDFGRLFGPYVGQSEAQLRQALAQAEALAPVVIWIDELEKGLAGVNGPSGDSGTTQRIFGSFLAWMQEKTAAVFIVATANNIAGLPPELLRKGRFDEIFFVDLPTEPERRAIWEVHLRKRALDPHTVPLDALVARSDGFTGAEIEQAVIEALYQAFADKRPVQPQDWTEALQQIRPISRVMPEQIAQLRQFARERARSAS